MAAARSGVSFRIAVASGSQSSRRACGPWPVRRSHSARVIPRGGAAEGGGQAEAEGLRARAPRQAQAEQAREEVEGRGQGRAVEGRRPAVVHVVDTQVVLDQEQVLRRGPRQEVQRRPVRPDHEVGAVVDVLPGAGVAIGGRAPAQDPAPLQQHHLVAALLEGDGGRHPGEAAADDDHPHVRRARSIVRAAIQALRGRERPTRPGPMGNPCLTTFSRTAR